MNTMKKLIWTCVAVLICLGCLGQRYEIWPKTIHSNQNIRGNYGFSNDSVLMVFTTPSWFFIPSKDYHYSWDELSSLKIRNKTKNEAGLYIGMAVGCLVSYMRYKTASKTGSEDFEILLEIPFYPFIGLALGHIATSKKTEIHMQGMSSAEKNELLKNNMKRKRK